MEAHQVGDAALGSLSQVFPNETAYFLEIRRYNAATQVPDPLEAIVSPLDTVGIFARPSEKDALRDFLPTLGMLSLQSVLDEIGSITATEMYETLERTRAAMPTERYRGTAERNQLENRLQAKHWPFEAARTNILGAELEDLLAYMSPEKIREINIARYASRLWLNGLPAGEQKSAESNIRLSLQYAVSDTLLEIHCQTESSEYVYGQRIAQTETIIARRQKAAASIIDFTFMGFPMAAGEAAPITRLLHDLR